MDPLTRTAFKMFGSLIAPYLGYFDTLQTNMMKAGMRISLHEYVCVLFMAALLTFIISIILGSFFITFAIVFTAYSYTLSIIISAILTGAVFFLGYWWPSLKAAGMKKEIDRSLPFASFYMTTTASSGINPVDIFKVLSLRKGIIGNEAKKIYTNVSTLGTSLTTVMQRTAARSPSPDFADLLWGMMSVITAGGDLAAYLRGKTETLMSKYRRSLNDYAKAITLYTEIYITLVIVGSLFFIVLISIISPMTGISTLFLQTFLV
ncbi:MAG: type II secretion system F family protein, partial [Candidatus Aenigmatarchaeota archaeon]